MYLAINKIKSFQNFLKPIQWAKKYSLLASALLFSNTIVQAGPYPVPHDVYDEKIELKYDPAHGAGGTDWVRRFEEVKNDQAVVCPSNRKQNCKIHFDTKITYTQYKTRYLAFKLIDGVNNFNPQEYTDIGGVITDNLTVNVNLKPGQRAVPIVYAYIKYVNGFKDNAKCSDSFCSLRYGIYYTFHYNIRDEVYTGSIRIGDWKGNVYANWNRGVCILNEKTPSPNVGDAVKNKCLGWNDPDIAFGKWPSRLPNLPYLKPDSFSTFGRPI